MNGQRNAIYSIAGHHNYCIDLKKKIISQFPSILDHNEILPLLELRLSKYFNFEEQLLNNEFIAGF